MNDAINALAPCPFCGSDIEHIESWAKTFDPPRLYHEWHHTDDDENCPIRLRGKIVCQSTDDLAATQKYREMWNTRAAADALSPATEVRRAANLEIADGVVTAIAPRVEAILIDHLSIDPLEMAIDGIGSANDAILEVVSEAIHLALPSAMDESAEFEKAWAKRPWTTTRTDKERAFYWWKERSILALPCADEAAIRADQREIDAKVAEHSNRQVEWVHDPDVYASPTRRMQRAIASAIRDGGKQP